MNKTVIVKDEEKLAIVILRNEKYGITAKGVARCHPEDTYNSEFGVRLANTKAWLSYYDKFNKFTKKRLKWNKEFLDYYTNVVEKIDGEVADSAKKVEELEAEYTDLLKETQG